MVVHMLSSVGYLSDGTWQRPRLGDVVALMKGRAARAARRWDHMFEWARWKERNIYIKCSDWVMRLKIANASMIEIKEPGMREGKKELKDNNTLITPSH
jgi:hypothetical protein